MLHNPRTEAKASETISCSPSSSQPLRLLIVEDSVLDVELISLNLRQAGFDFTYDTTDQLSVCQQYLIDGHYDAVLSDYRLPQFTAYQVLEILRSLQKDIPLILVTGMLGEEAAVECIKSGMTDYVLKERLFRLPVILRRSLRELALHRQQQEDARRIQQQIKRERLINHITQAMRETMVLDGVLQTTVNELHEVLHTSRCLIFRPNPTHQMQAHYVSESTLNRESLLGVYCDFYRNLHEALRQGQTVAIDEFDPLHHAGLCEIASECEVQAILIVPLIYQQQYLGGISLHQCDRSRRWTSEEIDFVQTIASQCAIAIHQVQLFQRVQQQAEHEQLLNQIGRTLNSSLDPEFILQKIVQLTGEYFQADRALIFQVEEEFCNVKTEWRISPQVPSMQGFSAPVSHLFDGVTLPQSEAQDYILHIPDYSVLPSNPTRKILSERFQTCSLLAVSVFIRGRFFGGIDLYMTRSYRTFSEEEIQLLKRLADQAAIALFNAQSYEKLEHLVQERTRELEREKQISETANRAKSEFLAHMSHELRTPLTGILGFANVLLQQISGPLNPKQTQYIEGISACGKHLLELINDLLDLSKIEAGKEELFFEEVVVQEICDSSIHITHELATARGISLSLNIASDVEFCCADKRRLKQILLNLLSNAVKFTEQGSVQLSVTQTHHWIQFAVIDTGIGISLEDQSRLFQAFQQLNGGLTRKYEGTGLGLVLARKLARLHGGDVTVESRLGEGSCFTLRLPRLSTTNCFEPNPCMVDSRVS